MLLVVIQNEVQGSIVKVKVTHKTVR